MTALYLKHSFPLPNISLLLTLPNIGTLFPILTDGEVVGVESFQSAVLIFIVPWGITGITLLFPRLSLASYAAEDKVTKICITLNSTVSALVRGFCAADFADLYTAEVYMYFAMTIHHRISA